MSCRYVRKLHDCIVFDGKRRDRDGGTGDSASMSSAGAFYHLANWKVILWVLSSLLALVEGVKPGGQRSEHGNAVRLAAHHWPSGVPDIEELGDGSDLHSFWGGSIGGPSPPDTEGDRPSRWERSPSEAAPSRGSRKNRRRPKSSRDCRLEKRQMRVRDLGLGFDSDEIVLFKYCAGSCHSARQNYDLALKAMLENGSLPKHSAKRLSTHPCCRPTRYETVSFMDAQTTWRTIKWLSAANCSCVG
ncbi:artemin-like [Conger conger]|uniref:artemin-like n=1 Tax=Conger conger TaxID=82655 RepID=UPI002A59BB6D|nr:artemin-like [Conger conger]